MNLQFHILARLGVGVGVGFLIDGKWPSSDPFTPWNFGAMTVFASFLFVKFPWDVAMLTEPLQRLVDQVNSGPCAAKKSALTTCRLASGGEKVVHARFVVTEARKHAEQINMSFFYFAVPTLILGAGSAAVSSFLPSSVDLASYAILFMGAWLLPLSFLGALMSKIDIFRALIQSCTLELGSRSDFASVATISPDTRISTRRAPNDEESGKPDSSGVVALVSTEATAVAPGARVE